MPMLIRLARIDQVPEGTTKKVKAHGTRLALSNAGGRFEARDADGRAYRIEVRGSHVYVAIDPDPNAAPAEVQQNSRAPHPIG